VVVRTLVLPLVNLVMAWAAQGDQIGFGLASSLGAHDEVMVLQVFLRTTGYAERQFHCS